MTQNYLRAKEIEWGDSAQIMAQITATHLEMQECGVCSLCRTMKNGRWVHPQTGIPKADLMAEVGVSAAGIQYLARGLAKVLARKSRFTFYSSVLDNNSSVTTVEGIWCAVGLLYASVLRSVQGLLLLLVSLCFSSEELSLVCLKGQVCLWGISQLLLHEEL